MCLYTYFYLFFSFAPILSLSNNDTFALKLSSLHEKYLFLNSESITNPDATLFTLTHMLNDMAFSTLIYVMSNLEDYLDYWQKQLNSKTTETTIKEHIKFLKNTEKIHAQTLGTLHRLRHNKYHSNSEYCTKTLEALSALIDITPNTTEHTYKNLQEKLYEAIIQMNSYKKKFDHAISNHAKPSHITQHWGKYLFGAIAISILGYTAYEYKHNISQWWNSLAEGLRQQIEQRIIIPIERIIQNLSLKNNETNQRDLSKIQEEIGKVNTDINHTSKILEIRQKAFEEETYKYYQRRPDISQNKVENYVKRHLEGDDTDVMRDIIEQARNIEKNLYHDATQNISDLAKSLFVKPEQKKSNFRLIEALTQLASFYKLTVNEKELQLKNIQLEALKVLYQGKQQWYLQEVNTMLGAMFPAALTLYSAYKISMHTFSTLFFKKAVLIPLQECILSVRKMLNRVDDGQQTDLSNRATGHLIYWTHKLRQYIIQLPVEHQENFKQDILELESNLLTVKQKHEVVKRMYDIYGFLKPEKQ